jgi:Flp pilus assembly protein TadG
MQNRRSLAQDCSGAITVEMAVIAMAIFFMVPVIMDITAMISSGITLSSSLRAGTQIALVQPNNTEAISDAIELSSGFPEDSVTVTTAQFCECSGTSTTCGNDPCPGTNIVPATYMTISASYTTPTVIEYPDPGLHTVNRSTTIRVR